jgi:signal transduction histidine kinase/CheY-like chemotaxis protein
MWSAVRRYGLALLLTVGGLAANHFAQPFLHGQIFFLLLGAVFVSSWYGGVGPGLLATICGLAGFQYFFLPPLKSLVAENLDDLVPLALFAVVALAMTGLNHRLRSAELRSRILIEAEQQARREAQKALGDLERELAERRRFERRQTMQFAITKILAEAESLEAAAHPLLQVISEGLGWTFGAAWQIDPPAGVLRCFACWSSSQHPARAFEEETRRRLFAPGVGLPGRVWSAGRTIWSSDVTREENFPRTESAVKDSLNTGCALPIVRRGKTVGVLEFYCQGVHEAAEGLLVSLDDLGQRIGQFSERKHIEQRLRILSEASNVLGTSLDYETTLASVARLVVPTLADACVIDLVEEDGSVRRLAPALDDREQQRLQEILREERLDERGFHPVLEVLRTGRPEVMPELTDGLLRVLAPEEKAFRELKKRGPQIGLCVPLATRGRILGALSLASLDSSRRYGPDDVALAGELARRCAVAVDNARLFREAQKASEDKTRFLAAVSHDLRTPVNAIMLLSSLIRRGAESGGGPRSGELVERCRRLESASRSFTELLTNLLELASLDTGQKPLQDEEFSLSDMLTDIVANLSSMARAKGLGLRAKPPVPDLVLRADRTELNRVLMNLISNALKFTVSGSVSIEVSRDPGGRVAIAVKDSGPGIPPEQLANIFNEFFQVRNPQRDREKGTGLGLAISRRIMAALGGELKVSSELGRGSTFTAILPADRVAAVVEPSAEGGAAESGDSRGGIASVLVVDDDLVSAEALGEILRQEGYRVSVAPSGEEAIRRLGEEPADLVLLDMMMPGLDGVDVIKTLREDAAAGSLRIIALTGDVTRERIRSVYAAGADAFLPKPLQVGDVLQAVRLTLAGETLRPA